MRSKSRTLLLLAVLVGVAAIAGLYYLYNKESSTIIISAPESNNQQLAQPLPANGSADTAAESILNEANAEELINADVESDAALLKSDGQAVSDFGQSINDTGL